MPGATTPSSLLETQGITKRFGRNIALNDISFSLFPGEIHTLVGENGAGKSTLIKILTGVYQPDEGQLLYQGEPTRFNKAADAQAAGISTIYQEINLIPLLSVARNIFLGREPRNRFGFIDIKEMNKQAAELVERLSIPIDVTRELGRLGLGVQQMVALARAVSVEARVVIMDEPTSSLEAQEVDTLFRVARRLRDDGAGLIFVSHRLDELWALCDRVTILRDGIHAHTGPMDELDRAGLVAHMLGRPSDTPQRDGSQAQDSQFFNSEPVMNVSGLSSKNRIHDISFDVRPGEVVGLGGLLGSGRSETVKAIYGDLDTESGSVKVNGQSVGRNSVSAALRSGIALLSEDRRAEGIIPELSVRDNIALAVLPRVSKFGVVSEKKIDDFADTFIRRLHIKTASSRQAVSELSGGNQQKVLIARWLCTEPKVFLLDEPTRGIDVGAKREVQALIDDLAAKGLAVVLISSEMDELVEGTDRIVVLHDGAVAEEIQHEDVTNSRLLQALAGEGVTELIHPEAHNAE